MIKKINFSYYPDYSANSFFPFYNVEKLYNTILIPENLIDQFEYFDIGNQINIEYNNKTSKYSIGYKFETIKIKNKKYLLFYIGRGIPIENGLLHRTDYKIVLKNKTIKLDTSLNWSEKSPKLFMGILALSGLYDFAFADGDKLILKVNNDNFIETYIHEKNFSYNVFSALKHNTILFLDLQNGIKGITELNRLPVLESIKARSLTTKRIKQKGSFNLKCPGGTFNLVLTSNNGFNNIYPFSDYINITNLDSGQYSFSIVDSNNTSIDLLYNDVLSTKISFNIVGSAEEDNTILTNTAISDGIVLPGPPQLLPRL